MPTSHLTENVGADERRRVEQHEQMKEQARERVQRDLREREAQTPPEEQAQVEGLARELQHKAVREVAAAEAELGRARGVARLSQVVDYLFYLVYGVIGLLIVLELVGARESSGFKQWIDTLTAPLVAPFRGLVADPAVGGFQLMLSYIVGLAVYLLLHLAINGALRLFVSRKTSV